MNLYTATSPQITSSKSDPNANPSIIDMITKVTKCNVIIIHLVANKK